MADILKWTRKELTEAMRGVFAELTSQPKSKIILALRLRNDLGFDNQSIRGRLGGKLDHVFGPAGLNVTPDFLDKLVKCDTIRVVRNLVWDNVPVNAKLPPSGK